MDWLESIIIGIVSGVVASIIFFVAISLIKPKIKISNDICREIKADQVIYKLKIVNRSRAMLTNVKYSLLYIKDNERSVGEIFEIPPAKSILSFVYGYNRKEDYSDYAIRLTFNYDEKAYPLDDKNTKLVFTIFAEHSRSNKSACFSKTFNSKNIKQGQFETGKSTKII